MKKAFFTVATLISASVLFASGTDVLISFINTKYEQLTHGDKPDYDLYMKGVIGYFNLSHQGKLSDKNLLTLIDFRKSSNEKRIWVIDMKRDSVIYHNLVSHGKNTGNEFARSFSNVPNSNKSSLGFYITGENYYGKHGLSLRLDGVEPGINNNARKRAIVMHSAAYVNPSFTTAYGRLGRSFGCPAIPIEGHEDLLKNLADKTCLFIYYPDESYLKGTTLQDTGMAGQYLEAFLIEEEAW